MKTKESFYANLTGMSFLLGGILGLFVNFTFGALLIFIAIVVSRFGLSKHAVTACPKCKWEAGKI